MYDLLLLGPQANIKVDDVTLDFSERIYSTLVSLPLLLLFFVFSSPFPHSSEPQLISTTRVGTLVPILDRCTISSVLLIDPKNPHKKTKTKAAAIMGDEISSATLGGSHAPKQNVENLEVIPSPVAPNFETTNLNVAHMTPEHRIRVEKRLKRKLDARCSLFVAIYIMNYLDRNNIAAARLKGLQTDLGLDNTEYETCLSILYVGYILMQVPSNMFINRIARPSLYLGAVMLVWGLISTLTGIVQDFTGMVVVRFFLGFVEAAFLPGALLILSKWYTRRELTTRNAILFCGNLISNAFSALVGAGVLSNMQGTLGHAAWRWLFWIEGAVTMLLALLALVILPDLPHNTRGFTEEERHVAQIRMLEDVGEADTDSKEQGAAGGLVLAMKDVRVWLMMFTLAAYVVGLSFNAFFVSCASPLTLE